MVHLVACKTQGCAGQWVAHDGTLHGQAIRCLLCKRLLHYCHDCGVMLSNFRRHREPGHVLYAFQRGSRQEVDEASHILLRLK